MLLTYGITLAQENDEIPSDKMILELFETASDSSTKNADAKQVATERLVAIGPHAVDVLVEELATKEVMKRVTLYEIFTKIGVNSWPYLVRGLKSESSNTRYRCADLIGEIVATDAKPALRELLTIEKDSMVLPFALKSLGKIGNTDDIELIAMFRNHEVESIRRNTASALGKIGDSSGIDYLIEMLEDEIFSVRYPAMAALIIIGDSSAQPLISFLKMTNNKKSIGLALEALAAIRGDRPAFVLIHYLESIDDQLSTYAEIACQRRDGFEYIDP
ncbi:MAG: HEAT repeat domain-containing protein [bacterium]